MTASWREALGFASDFHRLSGRDPLRTQVLWEALSRRPDAPLPEDLARVPDAFGPWSISRTRGGFAWTVADSVSHTDKLRRRLRDWRTERVSQDAVRLALIGESAAGSWGFKDRYCLSGLLASTLGRSTERPVEVVDLSVVNGVWERDCVPAVHAAMTLDPDVFVVFCGNNEARWLLTSLASGDVERVPSGFSARWSFLLARGERRVEALNAAHAERLASSLARTVSIIRAFGKEVVFVLPPFNLRDWRPPELVPHHLAWPAAREWRDAIARGRKLRREGAAQESEAAFAGAVAIDGGMCQASLHELGQAQLARDPGLAAQTLDRAVGAGLGPFVNAVPSLPASGRERLVELLRAFKVPYVDLPRLLQEDAGGPPGREHFLDYCHLSAAGHEVLVTHLARSLLRFTSLRRLASGAVSVDRPTDHEAALAALLGSIHNFQNGQADALVEGWLRQAVQHEEVRRIAGFLATTVTTAHRERVTVAVLREAGLVDAFLNERYLIFGLKFLYHERFDVDLQRMIQGALPATAARPVALPPASALNSLFYLDRRRGFGQTEREMSRRGWEQVGQDFTAYEIDSEVEFPSSPGPAILRIVLSPPWPGSIQRVQVTLDDEPVGEAEVERPYTVVEFPLDVRVGISRLRCEWGHLFCPEELEDPDERQRYWLNRGAYPTAAVLHELSVLPVHG